MSCPWPAGHPVLGLLAILPLGSQPLRVGSCLPSAGPSQYTHIWWVKVFILVFQGWTPGLGGLWEGAFGMQNAQGPVLMLSSFQQVLGSTCSLLGLCLVLRADEDEAPEALASPCVGWAYLRCHWKCS